MDTESASRQGSLISAAPPWVESFRGPPEIKDQLRAGQPVLIAGRNSGPSGYLDAAKDLHGATEKLRSEHGVDVLSLLPSVPELVDKLRAAPATKSHDRTGGSFTNRFLVLDHSVTHGVVFVVSAGSGHALDSENLQPVVTYLTELARRFKPALVYAKRFDRINRHNWAFGPLILELEHCQGWVGDGRKGMRRVEGLESILIFFESTQSRSDAEKIPEQTRSNAKRDTDKELRDGQLRIGAGRLPPPGFAQIRMREGASIGAAKWVLDCPEHLDQLAKDNEVASGLPETRNPDGSRVDQVANVMWALRHLGAPEWSITRIARELVLRGYSTERLRRTLSSTSATWQDSPQVAGKDLSCLEPSICNSVVLTLLKHLETYRTGVLSVKIGNGEDVTITNLFPPGGQWASTADWERIDSVHRTTRHEMTFSGLPVTANGVDAILLTRNRETKGGQERVYLAANLEAWPKRRVSVSRFLMVPPSELAEMVKDAIAGADDRALELVTSEADDDAVAPQRSRLALLEMRITEEQATVDRITATITGSNGQPIPPPLLTAKLQEQAEQALTQIETIEASCGEIRREIERERRNRQGNRAQAAADALLLLLSSLKDPAQTRFRPIWFNALQDLTITENTTQGVRRRTVITITGRLVIGDSSDDRYELPMHREIVIDLEDELEVAADDAIGQMLEGTPFRRTSVTRKPEVLKRLAVRLGVTPKNLALGACDDPRITRLATAVVFDQALSLPELAHEFGEPVELLERIGDLHDGRAARALWLKPGSPVLAAMYASAARNDGLATFADVGHYATTEQALKAALRATEERSAWTSVPGIGRRLLRPCEWCGSWRLTTMRILEPVGAVCLDCRKDRAGFEWPASPYDSWAASPEIWPAGTFRLELKSPAAKLPRRKSRPVDSIDVTTRDLVVALYSDVSVPVRDVIEWANVTERELYDILAGANIPKRGRGGPQRVKARRQQQAFRDRQAASTG